MGKVEEIRYFDEGAWRDYFTKNIAKFYASVKRFLKIRELLKKEAENRSVGELIKENPSLWKEIFFGSDFYKKFYGIAIKEEDIEKINTRVVGGKSLEEACEYVAPSIQETEVVAITKDIESSLDKIYEKLEIEKPTVEIEDEVTKIETLIKAVRDVLNDGKALLPLYNPISFFIVSIYSIPKYYAENIYPRLFEEETRRTLERYGIVIGKIAGPDLPGEALNDKLNIMGLVDGCPGWLIWKIIMDIYELFKKSEVLEYFNAIDEFARYVEVQGGQLKEFISVERFPKALEFVKGRYGESTMPFDLGDRVVKFNLPEQFKWHGSYYSDYYGVWESDYLLRIKGGEAKFKSYSVNYSDLIAFMAPLMFLGLAYVREIRREGDREYIWGCVLGWER
ncbi:hypothetical protein P8X24_11040 [Pyrococcus kukulkanii]|uniref:hypothetical protein n=1 Tax=Pyrococcus kukulkanii TaxID=1609559 RepID=UPI003566465C